MYAMEGLTAFETLAIYGVLAIAVLGLLYAALLRSQILREDKGTAKMQEVWTAIRVGADTYLRRELRSIPPLILVLTVALSLSVYIVSPTSEALERFHLLPEAQGRMVIGVARAGAFIMG